MKKQNKFNDFETISTFNFKEKCVNNFNDYKGSNPNNIQNNNNLENLQQICILAPTSLCEINNLILSLKQGQSVIVDLTYKNNNLTQKVLNYLNGATFALGATINKLVDNIYLLLPNGIEINKQ